MDETAAAATDTRLERAHDRAPHPDDVAELCFEVWAFLADRSVPRTLRLLRNYLEPERIPPARTLRHWAANWDVRADERARQLAPALADRALGRAFSLTPLAVDLIAEALNGELRQGADPKQLPAIYKVEQAYVDKLTNLLGMGALGWRGKVELDKTTDATLDDIAALSPQDAARALADRLRGRRR